MHERGVHSEEWVPAPNGPRQVGRVAWAGCRGDVDLGH